MDVEAPFPFLVLAVLVVWVDALYAVLKQLVVLVFVSLAGFHGVEVAVELLELPLLAL